MCLGVGRALLAACCCHKCLAGAPRRMAKPSTGELRPSCRGGWKPGARGRRKEWLELVSSAVSYKKVGRRRGARRAERGACNRNTRSKRRKASHRGAERGRERQVARLRNLKEGRWQVETRHGEKPRGRRGRGFESKVEVKVRGGEGEVEVEVEGIRGVSSCGCRPGRCGCEPPRHTRTETHTHTHTHTTKGTQ